MFRLGYDCAEEDKNFGTFSVGAFLNASEKGAA